MAIVHVTSDRTVLWKPTKEHPGMFIHPGEHVPLEAKEAERIIAAFPSVRVSRDAAEVCGPAHGKSGDCPHGEAN